MRGNPHTLARPCQVRSPGVAKRMRSIFGKQQLWLMFLVAALSADLVRAQGLDPNIPLTDPEVLCDEPTPGPTCTISQDFEIPDLSDVNFGVRHVILQSTLEIQASYNWGLVRRDPEPVGLARARRLGREKCVGTPGTGH